jgi:hypothetical protein
MNTIHTNKYSAEEREISVKRENYFFSSGMHIAKIKMKSKGHQITQQFS